MKTMLARFPKGYIYFFISAYLLPIPVLVLHIVFSLLNQGFFHLLSAFIGTFIVGAIVFFPFGAIYYAVLTFLHTLVDQIRFHSIVKGKQIVRSVISCALSLLLFLVSVLTVQKFEYAYGWIFYILMLVGCGAVFAFLVIRIVFDCIFILEKA